MAASLLPPGSTALERGLEAATTRAGEVPIPLDRLWNPDTCPAELLPWLAWGLSVDRWESSWSEPRKRAAIRTSIADHRIKGTPASIDAVLASFDALLHVVEWFEASPRQRPHTFEVVLPIGAEGGARAGAAFAEAVVRDVTRTKPARSHFTFVQQLRAQASVYLVGAARAAGFVRLDAAARHDPSPRWADYLQTEEGEPITDEAGALLEGAPA
ncbi:MAG TPA: phage tail protein I [Allosphingosinicella sp.]|jgi:phage tail P2-like protein